MSRKFSTIMAMVLLFVVGSFFAFTSLSDETSKYEYAFTQKDTVVNLELADDEEERTLGLSNRDNLDENTGILFEFEDSNTRPGIWMKDMKLTIDIIWLDKEKVVTTVKQNVSPDTYPKSFEPSKDSKYVIELNAGSAGNLELRPGLKIDFQPTE